MQGCGEAVARLVAMVIKPVKPPVVFLLLLAKVVRQRHAVVTLGLLMVGLVV